MSKFPTYPILYDEVLQLSTSNLKKAGYLEPGQIKSGIIIWSSNGNQTGKISIRVSTVNEPYLELNYKYNGEPRNYRVQLVSVPSNLGKGVIWYFLCPRIKKRCRKLYSVNGYFLHREAFKGCMYDCQTKSKKNRQFGKTFGLYLKMDELAKEIYSKNFTEFYAGKPTKRYLRIMKQLQKIENIPRAEVEKLL